MSPTELKQRYTRGPERGNNKRRGDDLRGCLRKNLQVNMWLKNRFLSYSSILKIYPLGTTKIDFILLKFPLIN